MIYGRSNAPNARTSTATTSNTGHQSPGFWWLSVHHPQPAGHRHPKPSLQVRNVARSAAHYEVPVERDDHHAPGSIPYMETNSLLPFYCIGSCVMTKNQNDRVRLEIKILKYRALAAQAPDELTRQRIDGLVAELEQKQREIDE
jgi:hypothetical protein